MDFRLVAPFQHTGDQPEVIRQIVDGINKGYKHQVLLGATGTGKTYTMAQVITQLQRPALVMAHNKTLAAQLSATMSLMSRKKTIIVASVSCIYGLGNPAEYGRVVITIERNKIYRRNALMSDLVESHFE